MREASQPRRRPSPLKRLKAGYHRAHWQAIRKARLRLAGYRCELGLPGCTAFATHVHLDPELRANHDAATIETTRACCASSSARRVDAPRARPATTARADTIPGARDSQTTSGAQDSREPEPLRDGGTENLFEPVPREVIETAPVGRTSSRSHPAGSGDFDLTEREWTVDR